MNRNLHYTKTIICALKSLNMNLSPAKYIISRMDYLYAGKSARMQAVDSSCRN